MASERDRLIFLRQSPLIDALKEGVDHTHLKRFVEDASGLPFSLEIDMKAYGTVNEMCRCLASGVPLRAVRQASKEGLQRALSIAQGHVDQLSNRPGGRRP